MSNNPYLPFKSQIINITKQTEVDWTYQLACDIKPQWGQFVEVSIPGVGECPISISDFGEGYIEMTIRRVGKVTNIIHQLDKVDHLFIRGPYGNGFPVPEFSGKQLIIAAGGTGLAPVKSIINHFYRNPSNLSQLDLLAGFKSPSDILFQEDLALWANQFNVLVTVDKMLGDTPWNCKEGLITKWVPEIKIPNLEEARIIVVGPPVMMKYTVQEFLKLGITEENIWVSFERKMCCGIGKCGHCKIDDTYVCLEGPVFNFTKAKNLMD
ncbi:anaerobic sulfite reductase subunit AsrB [Desulfotomaculum defluvii]